jgi:hypothetical protein
MLRIAFKLGRRVSDAILATNREGDGFRDGFWRRQWEEVQREVPLLVVSRWVGAAVSLRRSGKAR